MGTISHCKPCKKLTATSSFATLHWTSQHAGMLLYHSYSSKCNVVQLRFPTLFRVSDFVCISGVPDILCRLQQSRLRRKSKPSALVVRGLISSLILVTFIVEFVGGLWLSPGRPYSVLPSPCIQMLAWTVHVYCLWVLSCSVAHYGRGPLNLCAAWLLIFVGSTLNFVPLFGGK